MHKIFMYGVLILSFIYGCLWVANHVSVWIACAMVGIAVFLYLKSISKPKKQKQEDEDDN